MGCPAHCAGPFPVVGQILSLCSADSCHAGVRDHLSPSHPVKWPGRGCPVLSPPTVPWSLSQGPEPPVLSCPTWPLLTAPSGPLTFVLVQVPMAGSQGRDSGPSRAQNPVTGHKVLAPQGRDTEASPAPRLPTHGRGPALWHPAATEEDQAGEEAQDLVPQVVPPTAVIVIVLRWAINPRNPPRLHCLRGVWARGRGGR